MQFPGEEGIINHIMIQAVLIAALLTAPPTQAPAADPQETGRRYTEWFYSGKLTELWERFTPEMKTGLPLDSLRAFREQVASLGAEESVLSERIESVPPLQVYIRTVRFSQAPTAQWIVQWALDSQGRAAGFFIRPRPEEAATKHLEYQTKTPLRLPFDGEWYVFWGGRTLEQNYHVAAVDQRFAYDLVIRRDGKSHTGDGSANEQYHCFGQPILAPGSGKVAVAVDGIADNRPGEMNPQQPPGNHIVIDHGNGEHSLLAHFKKGSIAVKPGDPVKAGDRLGLCGNSGNSSEAHLHYHLQTGAKFSEGEGLPAQFLNYVADGKKVERGEPVKGQIVRP